jgi:EmrB/QacA subfamily drug resistance transporter
MTQTVVMSGRARWWGLAAMVVALLVVGIDTMVLNVALPTLATQLGATTTQLQWLTDAYTLAFAGLLLPAGLLGDRFGRKRLLVGALLLFGVASVLAAMSGTATELIWTRAAMGVGAAAIMPLTMSVLPAMFEPAQRTRAVAILTASVAVGLPLGPLLGGWLLQHFWWGSVFLINVPVVALAVVGAVLFVPESANPSTPRLDLAGTVLSVLAITGVVYGIIEVPDRSWGDVTVLVSLGTGLAATVAFVIWERRAEVPLVDLALFRNRRFTTATAAATGVSFVMFGAFFLLPLYLQSVTGTNSLGTGVRLLPMVGGLLIGGLASEKLATRFGVRTVITTGLGLLGAGMLLMALVTVHTGYGQVAIALSVTGLALGLALAPAMDTVLGELPEHKSGVGTALATTSRQVGAALSIAILGSLLNSVYRGQLDTLPAGIPQHAADAARENVGAAVTVAGRLGGTPGDALATAAREAFVTGMSTVMWVCVGFSALVAIGAYAFLPRKAAARIPPRVDRSETMVV